MEFPEIGLQVPSILLPRPNIDMSKWAVIACDQYTSQPEYWEEVRAETGGKPSTLNLIFPEVYLEEEGREARVRNINEQMRQYLENGTLVSQPPGFVLVDRLTEHAPSRKGLMVALDLDRYDYRPGAKSLIRATEGTILDRLPPRIQVREQATIELPHIMVLIDDPEKTVIEPLFEKDLEKIYDFPLMKNGGHIRGFRVDQENLIREVAANLSRLADSEKFQEKYRVADQAVVLYAMGDGNHSFATAKAIWEKLKKEATDKTAIMNHPARYALVELVNVHDPGLEFEAIHRVLFGAPLDVFLEKMAAFYAEQGSVFSWHELADVDAIAAELAAPVTEDVHRIPFVATGKFGLLQIEKPRLSLVVATLQAFLDRYLEESRAKIDYIHGDDVVTSLGSQTGNIGFYLPAISKHDLFRTIILDGALPRKTFSMGEADEKRFYLESRKICP